MSLLASQSMTQGAVTRAILPFTAQVQPVMQRSPNVVVESLAVIVDRIDSASARASNMNLILDCA